MIVVVVVVVVVSGVALHLLLGLHHWETLHSLIQCKVFVCMYMCVYRMYVCVYRMYVCMYVCVHVCM